MSSLSKLLAGAAIAILCLAPSVWAIQITSGGKTLLYDNFENPALPSLPDSDPNNLALPGDWANVTEEWETSIQVLDSATQSVYVPSAAYEGDNYLKLYRNSANCWVNATLSEASGLNDVSAQWMTYIPSQQVGSPTAIAVFTLTDQAANGWQGRTWVAAWAGGDIKYYNGTAWTDTGLNWTGNAWQQWTMDYHPDLDGAAPYTGTYTITVDGQTSGTLTQLGTGGYSVTRFAVSAGSNGSVFCVDAVPEPASILLVAFAGLWWVRRR